MFRDAGSFRDPGGSVFIAGNRVYRTVMPSAAADYHEVRRTGILRELMDEGLVIEEREVEKSLLGDLGAGAAYLAEHPRLPFVSYPYEWCFHALKDAALLQLEIHLRCVARGITLSDASAYNVQFRGPRPVFIDTLSFRPYREGEVWSGHRQFCEQYLNPLLLRACVGIPHNAWYRGSLEGIPVQHLARVLPWRAKISWNVIKHIVLQAAFERMSARGSSSAVTRDIRLPLEAFRSILTGLKAWIASLEPQKHERTTWRDYAENNSYSLEETQRKAAFVREYVKAVQPKVLWDLGCNTGEYSKLALQAGAEVSIGFDFDIGALERAYLRAKTERLNLLPLHLDAMNPSPSQGWAQHERKGLCERGPADGLLALALVHHLAIAKNVPLGEVVQWLVQLAPSGVIEFVQKSDPMVAELLRLREDIFPCYTESAFEEALKRRARICKVEQVSSTGRKLYWFES